jgi:voltage-gated potassium channel
MPTHFSVKQFKCKIWQTIEFTDPNNIYGKFFYFSSFGLIVLNIIAVILETVEPIEQQYGVWLDWFEFFSVMAFSLEYVLRIWSCTCHEDYAHPFWGRLKHIFKPLVLIDLIAILPFYITFISIDLRIVRILRLFRIFRVLKLGRYLTSLQLIVRVFKHKKEELIVTTIIMLVLLILTSSLVYFAEHDAQPDKFPNMFAAMWWTAVTLTTIGYGDIYPITLLGKMLSIIIAVLGIGMFALPTGILGMGFLEELQYHYKKKTLICPHCHKEIEK